MSEPETWEFEHTKFPPGTRVYIVPELRNIHPLSPVAGKHVVTTKGTARAILSPFRDYDALVPVVIDDQVLYIEDEYVMRTDS